MISKISEYILAKKRPFLLVAGPCVIEKENSCIEIAEKLKEITQQLNIDFIFKASFDKANRSSIDSFRGPGIKEGLRILKTVRNKTGVLVTTDIHEPKQAKEVAGVVDLLQIPAFLCRQTNLLLAAAKTGKPVNVKKGQFLAPKEMENAIKKIESTGNDKIILTERGTTFGYNNLVADMRSIPIMKTTGYPVLFDATHSIMFPGSENKGSGGQKQYITTLAKSAIAAGANGLFIETHPNPQKALSDSANMLELGKMKNLLTEVKNVFEAVNK